jgi:23S rRNA (pseudouridine1915-N3)-methyltransferase
MRIVLVSASNKQPSFIEDGFSHYARRLRGGLRLDLTTVAVTQRRAGTPIARSVEIEGERMLGAIPKGAHVVALDERGSAWSTVALAGRLEEWLRHGRPVALLVGGPDGLAPVCREAAVESWSLSKLTLPHGLVRVLVAEALYRAWSLLQNHPYHRA